MADRRNLNPNPTPYSNLTGWRASGGVSQRIAVTGFGVPYAFRTSSGAVYSESAPAPVLPSQQYTFSCYVRSDIAVINKQLYIDWYRADNSYITDVATTYSLSPGVVMRISLTAVSHNSAAYGRIVPLYGSTATFDMSMVLVESGPTLGDYFDGYSLDSTWDGTPGNSSSTFHEGAKEVRKASFMGFIADS